MTMDFAALLAAGADPEQPNDAGRTPAQSLEEQGADDVADILEGLRMAGDGA